MQKLIGTFLMVVIGLCFRSDPQGEKRTNGLIKRQTVETVSHVKGELRKVGEEDIYVIWCGEKHLRLNPLNLPEKYKRPGQTFTFSGNIKATNTLEDEWGEFVEITDIQD